MPNGEQQQTPSQGLAAQLIQLAPMVKSVIDRLKPVIDQPIIRFPYSMASVRGFVVAAGVNGARMPDVDFSHALEWPFEIERVKFGQDISHTGRDWRVNIKDQTFNQEWLKAMTMVDLLVANDTNRWELTFPWVVRPKGGGLSITVDNLDLINPITVEVSFEGSLLIPRV